MRILPGQPADIVGESISGYSLTRAAVNNADVLPRVFQVFNEEDYSPISSILADQGYFTKGLREGTWGSKFRTMGSNHVMFPIASTHKRKCYIAANENGLTYYCPAYPTEPGKNGSVVYVYLNNNWTRPKEAIELNDNKTLLYAHDPAEPIEFSGVWRYEMKLVTKDATAYINPSLLTEGNECAPVMAPYEHDFSETGSEKYTFDGWGHSYLSLQRVKMSWSGTAEAMKTAKEWYAYANAAGVRVRTYLEYAEKEMLKRAAQYHEYQLIFGQGTVTVDGNVFLHDKNGREVMMGDGLMYGDDGAIERPMTTQGWTMKFLESLMEDIDIRAGVDGKKQAILAGGKANVMSFYKMMFESGFKTVNNNVVGDGSSKGVNMDYDYFEWMGVRIIPRVFGWFGSKDRPQKYMNNGRPRGSWDSILFPLGRDGNGDKTVELIQLRPPVMGTMNGMNKGGEDMASSVDGASKHYLWQTGIIKRVPIYRIFMPYAA